ncbi:MAG: multicopper oxidase family protein [Vulcanimicrobiaceae bacterium]
MNAPDLPTLPEVHSLGGVASVSVSSKLDGAGRPAFFWNGAEVAPTIRVRPGDTIHFHYENGLPETCGFGLVSQSNLHFHGLASEPKAPGDDVLTTSVRPGRSFDYVVKIGREQPPGLYWYHPHPHGLTNWELGNGMAGAIVVEGIADVVPGLAGLRERVIVLRDVPKDPSLGAALAPDAKRVIPSPANQPAGDQDDQFDAPCGVETTSQTTINGLPAATLGIHPGERQLWRVLNASAHRHFDLQIPGVPVQLVALDGVPLRYYHGAGASETRWHVLIPPAGRAEFVIVGPKHPQMLYSLCFDTGPGGDENPGAILGELDDEYASDLPRVSPPAGLAVPALYSIAPAAPVRARTIRLSEDARRFFINGVSYRPTQAPAFTARAGTTEEWTIENDSDEVHAFHVHQVHFALESLNGTPIRDRHWVDVVDVPQARPGIGGRLRPSRIRILVDFRDPLVRGVFPLHCHMADHEDNGMMATIRVV